MNSYKVGFYESRRHWQRDFFNLVKSWVFFEKGNRGAEELELDVKCLQIVFFFMLAQLADINECDFS